MRIVGGDPEAPSPQPRIVARHPAPATRGKRPARPLHPPGQGQIPLVAVVHRFQVPAGCRKGDSKAVRHSDVLGIGDTAVASSQGDPPDRVEDGQSATRSTDPSELGEAGDGVEVGDKPGGEHGVH